MAISIRRTSDFIGLILSILIIYSQGIAGNSPLDKEVDNLTLREENLLLGAELKLAKSGTPYIVVDLSAKRIYLKNRGITLRKFEIVGSRYWAEGKLSIESAPLLKKKALFLPARKEIEPVKEIEGIDITIETTPEMDFLEVKEMPYYYTLLFEKGISISIKGQAREGSRFIGIIYSMLKHIRHSFMAVWNHLQKKTFTIIDIAMSREDAQALFWSLQEGTSIVISGGTST